MNTNVRFASFFTIALIIWFGSGLLISPQSGESVTKTTSPTNVQVTVFDDKLFEPTVTLRATTEPYRSVNMVAQIAGQISAVLVQEGTAVKKGQAICEISVEDRYFRLAQAKAHLDQSSIAYRGALKLKSGGFQSELAISQAKATLETAKANLKRAQLNVGHLKVVAPFDGIVESREVEIGDYVVPGKTCALIVDLDPLKVTALVNELEVSQIKLGSVASASIGDNSPLDAAVSYIAHRADPATRSYRLEAVIENTEKAIRAGLSARLNILTEGVQAHLIPASSILLNDQGGMIVRIIGAGNIAQSLPVAVLGETGNGIWVSGLPGSVNIITVGQNYVIDGEVIEPTFVQKTVKL